MLFYMYRKNTHMFVIEPCTELFNYNHNHLKTEYVTTISGECFHVCSKLCAKYSSLMISDRNNTTNVIIHFTPFYNSIHKSRTRMFVLYNAIKNLLFKPVAGTCDVKSMSKCFPCLRTGSDIDVVSAFEFAIDCRKSIRNDITQMLHYSWNQKVITTRTNWLLLFK